MLPVEGVGRGLPHALTRWAKARPPIRDGQSLEAPGCGSLLWAVGEVVARWPITLWLSEIMYRRQVGLAYPGDWVTTRRLRRLRLDDGELITNGLERYIKAMGSVRPPTPDRIGLFNRNSLDFYFIGVVRFG